MIISLYLPDFRYIINQAKFKSEENVHSVFYFEEGNYVYFYKYYKGIMYKTEVDVELLPADITLDGLKDEFSAIELPKKPDRELVISGSIH